MRSILCCARRTHSHCDPPRHVRALAVSNGVLAIRRQHPDRAAVNLRPQFTTIVGKCCMPKLTVEGYGTFEVADDKSLWLASEGCQS